MASVRDIKPIKQLRRSPRKQKNNDLKICNVKPNRGREIAFVRYQT